MIVRTVAAGRMPAALTPRGILSAAPRLVLLHKFKATTSTSVRPKPRAAKQPTVRPRTAWDLT